jgi:hypothetical protein
LGEGVSAHPLTHQLLLKLRAALSHKGRGRNHGTRVHGDIKAAS